jgi:hypothetical protein
MCKRGGTDGGYFRAGGISAAMAFCIPLLRLAALVSPPAACWLKFPFNVPARKASVLICALVEIAGPPLTRTGD